MLCELVGEGKERGWFVIADSLDSYSLLLLAAQKLRGEAVIACGLGRIIPFSLSCFFLCLEGGKEGRKEETMYVHGTGIVDNDYNAAIDSFWFILLPLSSLVVWSDWLVIFSCSLTAGHPLPR